MVKFTVKYCENTKFTRELNTYGFDENGFGEELLFPIRLNEPSGRNQETNLATYLVKFMEFEKTSVKIKKIDNKEWFKRSLRKFYQIFSFIFKFFTFFRTIYFSQVFN